MVTKADPAKRVAAMAKLIPIMREEHEKLGALIEEFESIAGGGPTIGEKLKHLEDFYSEMWSWRYGEPYVWPSAEYAKSRGQWKLLIKKLHTLEAVKTRVANYLRNGDDFFVSKKHPFGMFVATINQHVTARDVVDLGARPSGCKHDPPCADAVEHTRRRLVEQTT